MTLSSTVAGNPVPSACRQPSDSAGLIAGVSNLGGAAFAADVSGDPAPTVQAHGVSRGPLCVTDVATEQ